MFKNYNIYFNYNCLFTKWKTASWQKTNRSLDGVFIFCCFIQVHFYLNCMLSAQWSWIFSVVLLLQFSEWKSFSSSFRWRSFVNWKNVWENGLWFLRRYANILLFLQRLGFVIAFLYELDFNCFTTKCTEKIHYIELMFVLHSYAFQL